MNDEPITDAFMLKMRDRSKPYTLVIMKKGPKYLEDPEKRTIWEHGRRNHVLRREGKLSVVCPILDDSEYAGIGIFNCSLEETTTILEEDPAVVASVLTFEVHATRSFPGDALPG